MNLSNRNQIAQFSKQDIGLMVPKKSQNIDQNKSPTSDLPRKRKKGKQVKKKNRRLWKKGYKSGSGFCICIYICFCFFFIC